jgi:hypothetical protein
MRQNDASAPHHKRMYRVYLQWVAMQTLRAWKVLEALPLTRAAPLHTLAPVSDMTRSQIVRRTLAGVAVAATLAACADSPRSITSPRTISAGAGLALSSTPGELGEWVLVCKVVAPATGDYNYTVSAQDNGGGILPSGSAFTLNFSEISPTPPDCKRAWQSQVKLDGTETEALVTVAEVNLPADQQVDSIVIAGSDGVRIDKISGTNTVTVVAGFHVGRIVKYYNGIKKTPPPPPPGVAGCTPGYWKQTQHFASWVTYQTTDRWNTVFGRNFFSSSRTLLQALENGGGDKERLGRHSTAALLNAASPGVNYGMTPAQVIAAVQAAIDNGTYDKLSDTLEQLNERGCDLN